MPTNSFLFFFVIAITGGSFRPSPSVPALQYVAVVESESAAAEAGLQPGDFIIQVRYVVL